MSFFFSSFMKSPGKGRSPAILFGMTPRRRAAIVLVAVPALIVLSVVLLRMVLAGESGDTVQGILSTLSFTIPLFVAVVGWWVRGRAGDPASTAVRHDEALGRLAEVMRETWSREAVTRGIVVPAPVRVRWQWDPSLGAAPEEATAAASAGVGPTRLPESGTRRTAESILESGVVTRLHDEVYARLPLGRLVLVGGPGAGKTGAMILLLLAALDHRRATAPDHRRDVPVPVWLTLGGWDPASTSLTDWAAATVTRDHPYLRAARYGPDVARDLVRDGRVALFLDGLDEMPPALRSAALRQLEREAVTLRVVLSSRQEEFETAQHDGRFHGAAVIQVRPVRPKAAADYLTRDQPPALRDAWAEVGRAMEEEPDGVLARALDNPLMLSLARATYRGGDPAELARPGRFATTAQAREHLVDRVLETAYPDAAERGRVGDALGWVAHRLGASRDLAWWRIPDWTPPRRLRLVRLAGDAAVGASALMLTSIIGSGFVDLVWSVAVGGPVGAVLGVCLGALAGSLTRRLTPGRGGPVRLRPRWPGRADARSVTAAFLLAWLVAMLVVLTYPLFLMSTFFVVYAAHDGVLTAIRFAFSLLIVDAVAGFGLLFVSAVTLPVGVVAALVALWTLPGVDAAVSTPRRTYREDRRAALVVALVLTPLVAVTASIPLQVVVGTTGFDYVRYTVATLVGSAGAGLIIGARIGRVPAVLLSGVGTPRPVRLVALLNEACRRDVLRQAGAVWQFRHAEFQERLAGRYRDGHGLAPVTETEPPIAAPSTPVPAAESSAPGPMPPVPAARPPVTVAPGTDLADAAAPVADAGPPRAGVRPGHLPLPRMRLLGASLGAVLVVTAVAAVDQLRIAHDTVVAEAQGPVVFSPDGSTLIASITDGVFFRDLSSGRERITAVDEFPVLGADAASYMVQRESGDLDVLDLVSGRARTSVAAGEEWLTPFMTGAALRPDGGVVWADSHGRVYLAQPGVAPRLTAKFRGVTTPVPRGDAVAVLSGDDIEVRDVVTGAVRRQVHARGLGADPARQAVVAFDPTGSAVVVADGDGVRVADLTDGHVSILDVDGSDMSGIALSADHQTVAASYIDGLIRIWPVDP
jgi:hypothetical protein